VEISNDIQNKKNVKTICGPAKRTDSIL
jgi:hypothetical protein